MVKGSFNNLTTLCSFALFIFAAHSCKQADNMANDWKTYGSRADQSKYFDQDFLTPENVHLLDTAWTYSTGDERSYQNNPIIVDSIMYVFAKDNSLVALHAVTGNEIWIHTGLAGITRRGLTYWESKDRKDRRLLFTLKNTLQAIDAITGKSIIDFGGNGVVDLRKGLGKDPQLVSRVASATPGAVYDSLIIMGSAPGESYLSSPGHIRAYNVVTGEMAWVFHTIPQPGEYGYNTWPKDAYKYAGGVNCWGEITIDASTGVAYIPLGSPTYDYYGADRLGENLYGNCLLALDAHTGKRLWHYQTVHHDLWDYDLTAAPQLLTINKDGKKKEVVAIATKQGFLFVLDRKTGEPVWEVEERKVPASDMPGEQAWETQPFSTLPPFNRQTVEPEDISPLFFSKEEFLTWQERIRKARKGLFTPPSLEETVAMPGAVGGANWGNASSNPSKGLMYVLSQDYPSIYKLEERPPSLSPAIMARIESRQAIARGQVAFKTHCASCHGNDMAGNAVGPSLLEVGASLSLPKLNDNIRYGLGRMPAIVHIEDNEINDIHQFIKDLAGPGGSASVNKGAPGIAGPVVEHGPAPGTNDAESIVAFNPAGDGYPSGVAIPEKRYYTGYGLGFPFLMNPPWTSITTYDLNTGKILWTKPLGEEPQALAKGVRNTGVPTGSQRNGVIVTSNGLLFATVTNGKIYAMNAATGEILWTGSTPLGIAAIPSMYEVNGKVYLVVNATTPQTVGWNLSNEAKQNAEGAASKKGAYYVFSLPNLKVNE